MAKQVKQQQTVITCSKCGKQILPRGDWPIPVDYVWYNGQNICTDCIAHSMSDKNTEK